MINAFKSCMLFCNYQICYIVNKIIKKSLSKPLSINSLDVDYFSLFKL